MRERDMQGSHTRKWFTKIHFPPSVPRNPLISVVHILLLSSPFVLPSPFSPSFAAPSPPVLPGCRGDRIRERHFFPEAPFSPSLSLSLSWLCSACSAHWLNYVQKNKEGNSVHKSLYTTHIRLESQEGVCTFEEMMLRRNQLLLSWIQVTKMMQLYLDAAARLPPIALQLVWSSSVSVGRVC